MIYADALDDAGRADEVTVAANPDRHAATA
jgi:hypothetical protein